MRPGDVIEGRFEVERVAGAGGMGTVYRALDLTTGSPVAVKVLLGHADADRFTREARILEGVKHPAVVRYVARGATADGAPYLVMEWLEGEELALRLARGRLDLGDTVALARRLAGALAEVHATGIVHRDIKPSNLFLCGGRPDEVKLLDFGIALPLAASREITRAGTTIGTPGYMAPEQARGDRDVDARADLFSLGAVIFQCLTGEPAFTGQHVIALLARVLLEDAPPVTTSRPDTPAPLADLVAAMLRKRPADRPASAAAVLAALDALGDAATLSRFAATLEGPAFALPVASAQLTTGEQRLLAVILVAPPDATMAAPAPGDAGAPATMPVASVRFEGPTLQAVAALHGGSLDHLADGTSVLTLGAASGAGAATDRAALAARCALAARDVAMGAPLVLAMGLGRSGERAPVGEVIERAARLLRQRRRDPRDASIAIDDLTAGLLDDRFEVRTEGRARALLREREMLGADARLFLGRATPCVGRDRELASLEDEIDASISEPSARAVLVIGDAGVGKSRLRHELVRRLRAREDAPEIWIARGDPLGARSPFGLLGQVLQRAADLSAGEPLDARRKKLLARVARHLGGEAPRVADFLGELCGTPFPDEGNVPLRAARQDRVLMGDQMLRAWIDFVDAECRARPVLLILEDLHWGDLPTVQHVDAALRLLAERPFVVLALARPEVEALTPGLWSKRSLVRIHLPALPRRACLELARDVLGARADAPTLDRLWAQSAGNVFFLEELLRATVEGRAGDAPQTVLAMVQARIEGLDADARRVLRAASVFGQRFWRGGAVALLGAAPVDAPLESLVGDEVITRARDARFAGEIELVFRHSLVRDAAYAMLTEDDRRVGHRLAALWLEGAGEGSASALAEHFEKGAERGRAAVAYRRAAEQAVEGNDLALALAWGDRALACAADDPSLGDAFAGEVFRVQAQVHLWRGQNREAQKAGLDAIERLPPGTAPWYEATTDAAVACARTGQLPEVRRLSESLLETKPRARGSLPPEGEPAAVEYTLIQEALSASYAVALARVARLAFFTGEIAQGERMLREAEVFAEGGAAPPTVAAQVDLAHSIHALVKGDLSKNLRLAESARERFELAGDRRNACQQVSNVGYAYLQLGVHDAAERAFRGALAESDRLGIDALATTVKLNLGIALAMQSRLAEGIALTEEALLAVRAHADHRVESFARIYLARFALLSGDAERAFAEATAVVSEPATFPSLRAFALAVLSATHLAASRTVESLTAAREAMTLLASIGDMEEGEAFIRLSLAEALCAAGAVDAARDAALEARARLLDHAAKIGDAELRRSYLTNVPENARTLALAEELSAASPRSSARPPESG